MSYMIINNLKRIGVGEYVYDFTYQNICVLLPVNLLIFYLLPPRKFFSKENLYVLLGFLVELSLFEHFSNNHSLSWNYISSATLTYSDMSFLISLVCGIIILFKASTDGKIIPSYLLFAYIEVVFGLIYSDNSSALTMMFFAAVISIFVAVCYEIFHTTYYDDLTELLSRNSFIINSKHLPLKYCIGIICIDDFLRMNKIFRRHEVKDLIMMISQLIDEADTENEIYRYAVDEFVIVFKNETKDEAFNKIEDIRRKIAGAEFILSQRKKPIKLTVSAGISEKKRSDANAYEVLVRTRKALEQTNKFSQNITSKA